MDSSGNHRAITEEELLTMEDIIQPGEAEEFEYKLNHIKQQRRIISARAKKHYQVKAKDFSRWRR